jgi:hypothetical protein
MRLGGKVVPVPAARPPADGAPPHAQRQDLVGIEHPIDIASV